MNNNPKPAEAPAGDITPAGDPYVQQLLAENADLRRRLDKLTHRMGIVRLAYRNMRARLNQPPAAAPTAGFGVAAIARLEALRAATNQVLAQMDPAGFSGDPVNWGDLECRSAAFGVDLLGDLFYWVVVGEAAPDATDFCSHIAAKLADLGWPDVEVSTEW